MKAVRGGVFVASLGSIGTKLVLVVSDDGIDLGAQQPIVARITDNSRDRTFPTHVELDRGDGDVDEVSYVLCHDLTTLQSSDLVMYLGQIPIEKLWKVETGLRQALRLQRAVSAARKTCGGPGRPCPYGPISRPLRTHRT